MNSRCHFRKLGFLRILGRGRRSVLHAPTGLAHQPMWLCQTKIAKRENAPAEDAQACDSSKLRFNNPRIAHSEHKRTRTHWGGISQCMPSSDEILGGADHKSQEFCGNLVFEESQVVWLFCQILGHESPQIVPDILTRFCCARAPTANRANVDPASCGAARPWS